MFLPCINKSDDDDDDDISIKQVNVRGNLGEGGSWVGVHKVEFSYTLNSSLWQPVIATDITLDPRQKPTLVEEK